jgi:hypothetical protein
MPVPEELMEQWIQGLEPRIRHAITEGRTIEAAVAYVDPAARRWMVDPISKASPPESSAELDFWFGIAGANSRHIL